MGGSSGGDNAREGIGATSPQRPLSIEAPFEHSVWRPAKASLNDDGVHFDVEQLPSQQRRCGTDGSYLVGVIGQFYSRWAVKGHDDIVRRFRELAVLDTDVVDGRALRACWRIDVVPDDGGHPKDSVLGKVPFVARSSRFAAVVMLPYAASTAKWAEVYGLGVPIIMPSAELLAREVWSTRGEANKHTFGYAVGTNGYTFEFGANDRQSLNADSRKKPLQKTYDALLKLNTTAQELPQSLPPTCRRKFHQKNTHGNHSPFPFEYVLTWVRTFDWYLWPHVVTFDSWLDVPLVIDDLLADERALQRRSDAMRRYFAQLSERSDTIVGARLLHALDAYNRHRHQQREQLYMEAHVQRQQQGP